MKQIRKERPAYLGLRIGETPCLRHNRLSSLETRIIIKDESENEASGTAKDRKMRAVIERYRHSDNVVLVQITAGNAGLSLLELVKRFREKYPEKDWKVVNIISSKMDEKIKAKFREYDEEYSTLVEHDSKQLITDKEMMEFAESAAPNEHYEIIQVESHEHIKLEEGYWKIWQEIVDADIRPDYVFLPAGSGETLLAIVTAALNWTEEHGEKLPIFVGMCLPDSPLLLNQEFVENDDDSPNKIRTPHSPFLGEVKRLEREKILHLVGVDDLEIGQKLMQLTDLRINVERASATAFCGPDKFRLEGKEVVIINTGKGKYSGDEEKRFVRRKIRRLATFLTAVVLSVISLITFGATTTCTMRNGVATVHNTLLGSYAFGVLETSYEQRRAYLALAKVEESADLDKDGRIETNEIGDICKVLQTERNKECRTKAQEGSLTLVDFRIDELDCYHRIRETPPMIGQFSMVNESNNAQCMGILHDSEPTIREILNE
ncbi:PLP-dependent lyase/thiolase [Candidatus Micrarchaeota archaeon]|nr:PLP-dependent lyase/thiolase [Candidatus Micrarchaeota archaeon]MBU1165787.1 PLP-dependent lyase/thiolase [Candidatus Micrarchaeota archaeon]MBU1886297.1 PLP-dependent lyase/thiolase [Candidatus Micrarchaeota archaeon]